MENDSKMEFDKNKESWKKIELSRVWLIFFVVGTILNYIYAAISYNPVLCGPVPFCGDSYVRSTFFEILAIIPITGLLFLVEFAGKKKKH